MKNESRRSFPFAAVMECGDAKDAVLCAMVCRDLRTALIRGPAGTGKSAIMGSLKDLFPEKRIISVPPHITEGALFGETDIEATVAGGEKKMGESLMMRADGGILIAENIGLMDRELLLRLLDAVLSGTVRTEREGISACYLTDTVLIATADPSDGGLSEHIMDRFDMCADTENIMDADIRREMAERNIRFMHDPDGFIRSFEKDAVSIRSKVRSASLAVKGMRISEEDAKRISGVCMSLNTEGHRGDVATARASCALAALAGCGRAEREHIERALRLCLRHRRKDPGAPEQRTPPKGDSGETAHSGGNDKKKDDEPPKHGNENENDRKLPPADGEEKEDVPQPPPENDGEEKIFETGDAADIADRIGQSRFKTVNGRSGRRDTSVSKDRSGRYVGYRMPNGAAKDIALLPTVRAAAPYQTVREHRGLAVTIRKEDLREKVRERKYGAKILFLVDGSGSMGAGRRMTAVKGAVLSMLYESYQRRDEIGLAVFRGRGAEEVLPLTGSVSRAFRALNDVPTGGRTPLTLGLMKGYEILSRTDRRSRRIMVILTDGRGNVNISPRKGPKEELIGLASSLAGEDIKFIVVDTEIGLLKMKHAAELCNALKGTYLRLEELNAKSLSDSVRGALEGT